MKKRVDLGLGGSIHRDPNLIIEASYSNPLVRRWHKRVAMGDDVMNRWLGQVKKAGREDAETLLRAFNSELIGFVPGEYRWKKHEGIYTPEDELIKIPDRILAWAEEVYGDGSPEVLINKTLGVTNPSQLSLRLAGTASPVLAPKITDIAFSDTEHYDEYATVTVRVRGFLGPKDEVKIRAGAIERELGFREDGTPVETAHHSSLFLPSRAIGKGLGLAVFSSNQAWEDSLGFEGISLTAADVGRYVWPKLGFDGFQWEDLVDEVGDMIYEIDPDEFESEEEARNMVYEDTLHSRLSGIADYTWGEEKVGRDALLSFPDLADLVKWNNDNDRIYNIAEERVRRLEEEI